MCGKANKRNRYKVLPEEEQLGHTLWKMQLSFSGSIQTTIYLHGLHYDGEYINEFFFSSSFLKKQKRHTVYTFIREQMENTYQDERRR